MVSASADGQLAMTPTEVQDRLKLKDLKDKIWYVVPSCATTGEGLFEGLVRIHPKGFPDLKLTWPQGWLSNNVKTPPQRAAK